MTTPLLKTLEAAPADAPATPPFANAAQAWLWATEVLRRKRLPASSPAWRDSVGVTAAQRAYMQAELARQNLAAEATQVADAWGARFRTLLPAGSAERYALAQRIQAAVLRLPVPQARLLQNWAWGDWADDARLRAALAVQEKARREGLRVRLAYRYSAQQLAVHEGCGKVQAWRRLHQATRALETLLQAERLIDAPDPAARRVVVEEGGRRVEVAVFRPRKEP